MVAFRPALLKFIFLLFTQELGSATNLRLYAPDRSATTSKGHTAFLKMVYSLLPSFQEN